MGLIADWKEERRRAKRWRENVRLFGSRRIHVAAFATNVSMMGVLGCGLLTMAAGFSVTENGVTHSIGVDPWVFAAGTFAFILAMACASSWFQAEISMMNLRLKLAELQGELDEEGRMPGEVTAD